MAAIEPDAVRSLVTSLDALTLQAKLLPDASRAASARSALDELKATLPEDVGGPVTGKWAALGEGAQQAVFDKLATLHTNLTILSE